MFGECDGSMRSVSPGFTVKADVLAKVGLTVDHIRTLEVSYCQPGGNGNEGYEVVPCESLPTYPPQMAQRYDYCIIGSDTHGNSLAFGVAGK